MGASEYIVGVFCTPPSWENLIMCLKNLLYNWNTPFAPQMWTIHYEVIGGSICFMLIALFGKKSLRVASEIAALLISVFIFEDANYQSIFSGLLISEVVTSTKYIQMYEKNFVSTKSKTIGLILLLGVLEFSVISQRVIHNSYLTVLADMITLLIAYTIWKDSHIKGKSTRVLRWLGEHSYSFYMVLFMLIVSVGAGVYTFLRSCGSLPNWVVYSGVFICVFGSTLILTAILQDYFVKYIGKLYIKIYQGLR